MTRQVRSLLPQKISEDIWYYEQARSLMFVVRAINCVTGSYAQTIEFAVPAKKLRTSLSRMAAAQRSNGPRISSDPAQRADRKSSRVSNVAKRKKRG